MEIDENSEFQRGAANGGAAASAASAARAYETNEFGFQIEASAALHNNINTTTTTAFSSSSSSSAAAAAASSSTTTSTTTTTSNQQVRVKIDDRVSRFLFGEKIQHKRNPKLMNTMKER